MFLFELFIKVPFFSVPQRAWTMFMCVLSTRTAMVLACLPWLVWGLAAFGELAFFEQVLRQASNFIRAHTWSPSDVFEAAARTPSYSTFFPMVGAVACQLAVGAFLSTVWLGPVHIAAVLITRKVPADPKSHGSAAWGTAADATRAQKLWPRGSTGGLLLGRMWQKLPRKQDPRFRVNRHVLTCAPTGAGKGVGCVVPNLLAYPGAVVCLDVKGENYALTAAARRKMGQQVYCLDPFRITGDAGHSLNWLDVIDLGDESCVSDAAALAETLVVRSAGHDGYWDDAAAHLLQGMLLYVASLAGPERHMGSVRWLLTQPETELTETMQTMAQQDHLAYGIAARVACSFMGKADRERSAVLSTALRHTAFLDDPRLDRVLRTTQIDFAELKATPATVYIVLPPDKLVAYGRFARATLGLAMQAMMRRPGRPQHDVLFLLDEFAQLGHFAAVEQNVAILRGYGATLWLLVQDLSQLRGVYAKWETFLANMVLQAFGTQDMHTARYISDMLGQATLQVASSSETAGRGADGGTSSSTNESRSAHARPLLTPDEVRRMGVSEVLVFEQGQSPQRLIRLDYRTDPEVTVALPANPMFAKSAPRVQSKLSAPMLKG